MTVTQCYFSAPLSHRSSSGPALLPNLGHFSRPPTQSLPALFHPEHAALSSYPALISLAIFASSTIFFSAAVFQSAGVQPHRLLINRAPPSILQFCVVGVT
ncbi:hypothetical protein NP233_g2705 [Leucocoprinus birnbaumii]|uniref:Uncharacterized protein n=1 Tax=Leucocoprinus birnbaumii TaxID=56174 RepID=A0AAD5W453_9AGAR|nr:hypothetical protein NP233_g2705 [Leucocoprinus birnbaumii]